MDSLKELIGAYLARTGKTKQELAKELGMSRSTLRSKINGQTEFTLSEGYALKEILNVTADELFAGVQAVA